MRRFLLLLVLAVAFAACEGEAVRPEPKAAAPADSAALAPVFEALQNGRNVVVTFLTEEEAARLAEDPNAEAYAGWAFRLNDFLSDGPAVQFMFPMAQARTLFARYALPDAPLSLLFVRPDRAALYHPEPLLDDSGYAYVRAFFEGREDTARLHDLLGLPAEDVAEPEELPAALGFERLHLNDEAEETPSV